MLNEFLDTVIHWIETMSYEEYFVVVLVAVAVGFVFLRGMGSSHHL